MGALATEAPFTMAPFLHADFGLADVGGTQASTISATIGSVTYRTSVNPGGLTSDDVDVPAKTEVDALARGRTVGSSRGAGSSTLISGPVRSRAAGGGNPVLDPGYAGYFVFENAGLAFDDVEGPNPVQLPGGVERPLGSSAPNVGFAIGRLAIATGTASRTFDGSTSLVGYAAGLTEVETPAGVTLRPFADPRAGPNLSFHDFDLAANTFEATITGGNLSVNLGGAGASAWVDDATFGARSPDGAAHAVALMSGGPIAGELAGAFVSAAGGAIDRPTAMTTSNGAFSSETC